MVRPVEEAVVRAALARGYLTRAQLEQALARSAASGEGLLPLLRPLLSPSQLADLGALYRQLAASAPAAESPAGADAAAPERAAAPRASDAATRVGSAEGATLAAPAPPHRAPITPGASGPVGPGRRVGPYVIERELARGGMGTVSIARHVELGRVVALKQQLAGGLYSADAVARFLREGRALAQLDHPGVVRVYEVGEGPSGPFLAMDLVEGESLEQRLDREGPLAPSEVARIGEALARAVAHCHARGLLHRDLKPANVLLPADGQPRLTDFGVARDAEADAEALTRTGQLIGTPAYMAPEQAGGEKDELDERSDVYGLGATLYALLTGRPPFEGESAHNVVHKVLTQEPAPPSRARAGVPVELDTILLKCLDKQRHRRYPSAEALAEELARFARGEPILARPVGSLERARRWAGRQRRVLRAAGGGALLAALAYGGTVLHGRRLDAGPRPTLELRAPPLSRDEVVTLEGAVRSLRPEAVEVFAPDGTRLATIAVDAAGRFRARLALPSEGEHTFRVVPRDALASPGEPHVVVVTRDTRPPRVSFEETRLDGEDLVLVGEVDEVGCSVLVADEPPRPLEGRRLELRIGPEAATSRVVVLLDAAGHRTPIAKVLRPGRHDPEVLAELTDGGRVLLLPGRHVAAWRFVRPVALIGWGRERVELVAPQEGGPALVVGWPAEPAPLEDEASRPAGSSDPDAPPPPERAAVEVRGLTLGLESPASPAPVIWVRSGALRAVDCRIRGGEAQHAVVAGSELTWLAGGPDPAWRAGGAAPALPARLELSRCEALRGEASAVRVGAGARARLVECDLTALGSGASSMARRARDTEPDGRIGSVHLEGTARAWLERCTIHHTSGQGVTAWDEARVVVEGGRIANNFDEGLMLDDAASGRVRGVRFEENSGAVYLENWARLLLEDCVLSGSRGSGILFRGFPSGELVARDCTIERSRAHGEKLSHGIDVKQAALIATGCVVLDNSGDGIRTEGSRQFRIEGCTVRGNGRVGIAIYGWRGSDPARGRVAGTTVEGHAVGVHVSDAAHEVELSDRHLIAGAIQDDRAGAPSAAGE